MALALASAGKTLAFPLLVAPAGLQQVFHPDGEKAVARAAAKQGIPMVTLSGLLCLSSLHCFHHPVTVILGLLKEK